MIKTIKYLNSTDLWNLRNYREFKENKKTLEFKEKKSPCQWKWNLRNYHGFKIEKTIYLNIYFKKTHISEIV